MSTPSKGRSSKLRFWKCLAAIFILVSVALLIALIFVIVKYHGDVNGNGDGGGDNIRTCGASGTEDDDVIDLSEPLKPGPFHDLTSHELMKLRVFLERDRTTRAFKAEAVGMDSSAIYTADLFLPPKADVLNFLAGKGPQPPRQARVTLFRGDLRTPVIEEYICGPLPDVGMCRMATLESRRNPVEFSIRPLSSIELSNIRKEILTKVDEELGDILLESYGSRFTQCNQNGVACLLSVPNPVGTGIHGHLDRRRMWMTAAYGMEHGGQQLDFGILLNLDSHNVSKWSIDRIWYAGRLYTNTQQLLTGYAANSIPKTNVTKPLTGHDRLTTGQSLNGDPWPNPQKRPPTLIEPDGKRYKVKDRKVEYMDWTFHFRLSPFTGVALNDVRFKGERIVYDMGLQELAVFYSGFSPLIQTTSRMHSGQLLGTNSNAMIAGGDCPDTATFIDQKFMAQTSSEVAEVKRAICLFENNQGFPLRRHVTFGKSPPSSGYTGMLNSALTLRTAMTLGNSDYVLDYVFHQDGVLETKWMSTGHVLTAFYSEEEKDYTFRMPGFHGAPLHQHLAHFKVDLDVSGTVNRYETLDITAQDVPLTMEPSERFQTTKLKRSLKKTELDSVHRYDFDSPQIHLVHNEKHKNQVTGEMKAYSIDIQGMSKQLRYKRMYNEVSIPWARHQLVMTSHKDHEFWSSSPYAMWDSAEPVVDFGKFYTDNDNITDQDLVAWITLGMHHVPRSEDFPIVSTVGNHKTFRLLPFNYYPECPSVQSSDNVRLTNNKQPDNVRLTNNKQTDNVRLTNNKQTDNVRLTNNKQTDNVRLTNNKQTDNVRLSD